MAPPAMAPWVRHPGHHAMPHPWYPQPAPSETLGTPLEHPFLRGRASWAGHWEPFLPIRGVLDPYIIAVGSNIIALVKQGPTHFPDKSQLAGPTPRI